MILDIPMTFHHLIAASISILPVLIFLIGLILIDSYKLVSFRLVISSVIAGILSAIIAYLINDRLLDRFYLDFQFYTRYIAPFIEESCKALFVIYLIRAQKTGFIVDTAIFAFAVGAGFAMVENIYYLINITNPSWLLWILRGLGSAVMHGGSTTLFAIISKSIVDRFVSTHWRWFLPGWFSAVFLHSFFNHFLFAPIALTIGQILILPLVLFYAFYRSEKMMHDWLEIGFDADLFLLKELDSGHFSDTKIGNYLQEVQSHFSKKVRIDLYCYIRIYFELSVLAKGMLMMKQAGFRQKPNPSVMERFKELHFLEKNIGPSGMRVLRPLLHSGTRDLWQIHILDNSN